MPRRQKIKDQAIDLREIIRSGGGDSDSSNFIQTVIDGIPDPVLIIDPNFAVTAMNATARKACGDLSSSDGHIECYRMMERLGTACGDPDRPCSLFDGKACRHIQERTSADGRTHPAEIRMTPLMDAQGQFAGAVEVVHDLSESEQVTLKLRQDKEDAETVSRAKTECIAMMSHEVRTPMNAILGMVDLLQLTSLTRKQQDYMRTIQSSGNTLLSLVDNVLDYSELQAGELVINNEAFDIRRFIEHVLEMMGYQAYSKGLELACRIDQNVPSHIVGDEDRLRQVLVNLLSNAVRFTDHGEVIISVSTEVDADGAATWICAVTDTGMGISPQVKASLFDPFVRDDQRDSSRIHGGGLGLTICKWLIDGMGGKILVDDGPDRGTHMSFRLPLEVPTIAESVAPATGVLSDLRALVVHGNERMTAIIGDYLSDWGVSWDTADTGETGMEQLQTAVREKQPYDVVLIEAGLPAMDGLSLARAIRAEQDITDLPVIMLTSIAHPLEIGQISQIGGIRCVNKPVLPSELQYNLRKLIAGEEGGQALKLVSDTPDAVAGQTARLRILIAEDNPLNRKLLLNMLASLDYEADSVDDGPDVLEALARKAYDLILMDCQMPGMDGHEVTQHIRSEPHKYRSQPVIVAVTADVSAKHRVQCSESGMDDFIAKPIRRQQLLDGLQHWQSKASSHEQDVRTHLQDRANDNQHFLVSYIDLFVADTDSRIKLLLDGAAKEDWDAVRRQGHALKGACLEMGAIAMSQQCEIVRRATEKRDAHYLCKTLLDLEQEFERIRPVLEASKKRLT